MFDEKRRLDQVRRIEAGRRALDRIEGKTSKFRMDGYVNLMNKYGTQRDNTVAYQYQMETLVSDSDLTELYMGGGLFSKIIDAPADEAVKKGFDTGVTDQDAKEYIDDTLAWLEWDENIATAIKYARLYGGSIAVMMVDDGGRLEDPLDMSRVRSIDEIMVFDRSIAQPDFTSFYTSEPVDPTGARPIRHRFMRPEFYDVSSIYGSFRVHESRCLVFRNGRIPERFENTQYRSWGFPEHVRIKKELQEAVTSTSYSVKMLEKCVQAIYSMKNLAELLATDGGDDIVLKRLQIIDMARNVLNSIAIDADGESYDFKSMTLSGVRDIVETSFSVLSAVSNIPQTILFGRSPAGENSTGHSDMENWYAYVGRLWRTMVQNNVKYLLDIIVRAGMAQGRIKDDPKVKLTMNPLWEMSEDQKATVDKTKADTEKVKADTLQVYVDMQAISPTEVRAGLAKEGDLDISALLDEATAEPEDETWGLGQNPAATPQTIAPANNPQGRASEAQEAQGTPSAGNLPTNTDKADTGGPEAISGLGKLNGVGVIVVKNGLVLVGRRKSDFDAGTICGPGGHIEPGETSRQAAVREAKEEFQIDIDPDSLTLVGVDLSQPSEYGSSVFYLTTQFTGDPKCDEVEMTDAQFANASELMERREGLFPPFASSLECLFRVLIDKESPHGYNSRVETRRS